MIPPKESAAFVARMEDVLGLHMEPHDPERPAICLDETPAQLLSHAREPLPMRPGDDRKEGREYVREGTASVFAALDLKGGRRLLQASERRAKADFARFVDETCPGCQKVRLVLDNLSAHSKAAPYEAFEPEEAYRLAQALELHLTPKHGSWLNAVGLESSAARSQCLARRASSLEELRRELTAWQDERNAKKARVRWTFDAPSARVRLKRIYPSKEPWQSARCTVPGCGGACVGRLVEEALWQAFCTAAPARRREFEPSSKRRKRRPAPSPPATG